MRLANEHNHYTPGDVVQTFELNGYRICPMICYDLRFPVWSRNRDDYDLLLYVRSADVFVVPCVEADGLLAGPLAYAAAAGKPIVTTPCLHGRELA